MTDRLTRAVLLVSLLMAGLDVRPSFGQATTPAPPPDPHLIGGRNVNMAGGPQILRTATATSPGNSTSEFSACVTITP